MIRRWLNWAWRAIAGLFAVVAILLVALLWRLQSGPLPLTFLTPYVEQALNDENGRYRIALQDTVLTWGGWQRTIDVRVVGAQATDRDGRTVVEVPEIAVSFSPGALLRGIVAPRSIEIFRPELHLVRDADGRFAVGLGEDAPGHDNLFERIAAIVASPPSPDSPVSYLKRVGLVDAQLFVEDRALDWSMAVPVTYLELRRDAGGATGEATLHLPLEGASADIFVQAGYLEGGRLGVTAQFADLNPRALAAAVTPLAPLAALDAAVSGSVRLGFAADGQIERAGAEVSSAGGTIDLAPDGGGHLRFVRMAGQADAGADGVWRGNAEMLVGQGANPGRLTAAVTVEGLSGRRDVALRLDDVLPADLAGVAPQTNVLSAVQVPLSGTVTASMDAEGKLEGLGFDVSGAGGQLVPPLPDATPMAVTRAQLRGHVEGAGKRVAVDALELAFTEGTTFLLPATDGHAMPIRSFAGSATYDAVTDTLTAEGLRADLAGPQVAASIAVTALRGEPEITVKGGLTDVPLDQVRQYWPATWGKDAHRWVSNNMSGGTLTRADAEARVAADGEGGFNILAIDGTLAIAGTSVSYLGDMPPATGVSGHARFDRKTFTITVEEGAVGDLQLSEGTIKLTDIDAHDSYGDFVLDIGGPFNAAMDLIDREPLGFASVLGLSPEKTGGWASTRLHLYMILENDLTIDRIEVDASAELRDVLIQDAVLGLDIGSGNLLLKVDKKGMDVSGRILLGSMPGVLDWRENFTDDAPFRSRYDISGSITERQRSEELGLDFPPFSSGQITGLTNATVRHTVYQNGRARMEARIDLAQAGIDLSFLNWTKVPGVPGAAEISVDVKDGHLAAVPRFTVAADDLSIVGSVVFADQGARLDRLTLDEIQYGRTDLAGLLIRTPEGGWDADFSGESFDMSTMLGDALTERPDTSGDYEGPPLSVSANVQTVWLGPDRRLTDVVGAVVNDGKRWNAIRIDGKFDAGQPFQVRLEPAGPDRRRVAVHSGDAGAALRGLGLYDNMIGGNLSIAGEYDDAQPDSPLRGRITVDDFRVVKAPVLVQLLSVMALTGVLDVLQGDGLAFNSLEAPFVLENGIMTIEDGRAAGTSIGFTASGRIDTRGDALDLEGTVVPAYLINSVLGRLPLVGGIFTGGEKGSGVFAATYSMRGSTEEPSITVNPLSALAPGFLRNLFGIFDGGSSTSELPSDAPPPAATPEPVPGQ